MSASEETMLRIRINTDLKNDASVTLKTMGMSMSEFIRIALIRVVHDQAIPFDIKVPNATTIKAMNEARAIAAKKTARLNTTKTLLKDLAK